MTEVQVQLTGDLKLIAAWDKAGRELDKKTSALIRHHGQLLKTRIQANASGRPGPNAPTGDYRRSWTVEFSGGIGAAKVTVGTNAPQARRLEFGFHGSDSLGRVYNQPPYPHVAPAIAVTEPEFYAGAAALVKEILG